jgi:hypothetical protein
MSKYVLRWIAFSCATLAMVALAVTTVYAQSGQEAARLDCFVHPDGTSYFALSLQPPAAAPVAAPHDVVILVSTSAGQTGEYRAKAFEALQSVVAGLRAGDRVRLIATDLKAIPLTKGFVAPDGAEWKEAVAALQQRTPLGSNDLEKALTAAAASFGADAKNPRALIYIGDGSSRAKMLSLDKFRQLASTLADEHVPVLSYGVGFRVDRQILGVLAGQTGGMLIDEPRDGSAGEAGRELAAAVHAAVFWPTGAVKWPAQIGEVFPKTLPPLRSDRDTIVIGTLKGKDPLRIEAAVDGPGGATKLSWTVAPGKGMEDNNYLPALLEQARSSDGLSLPLVSSASLAEARQQIQAGGRTMTQLAQQALVSGNLDGAERLADEALRRDSGDPQAQIIKRAVAKARLSGGVVKVAVPAVPPLPVEPAGPADGLNLVGPAPAADVLPAVGGPNEGAAAQAAAAAASAQATALQTEVQNVVNKARGQMQKEPERALQDLRVELEKVQSVAELSPDTRDQLASQLQSAMKQATTRQIEVEHIRQAAAAREAQGREEAIIAQDLTRKQDKVKQLIDRVDFLLKQAPELEGEEATKTFDDARAAARKAMETMPSSPATGAAENAALVKGYYQQDAKATLAADRGVVDVLYSVDIARVPFNDETPIVYPDAKWWREMTKERKARWGSKDLMARGPAEKRIEAALKSPTRLEFVDTPLTDVIDYLKDYHQIEIQLDKKAMEEASIDPSVTVTKNLNGVSLQSALRLMLHELGLTYVIQNEVLYITTTEAAEAKLSTRVYSVADLVIPIKPPNFAGGLGGLGGFGGMGGQGGGFGGGMNGAGGMGGIGGGGMGGFGGGQGGFVGGGGGMGGGGMFSVPAEVLPQVPVQGFVAFSVKEEAPAADAPAVDAPAKAKAAAPVKADAAAPATIQAAPARPAKIPVNEIVAGKDPKADWEHYFATHEPEPAAVREAVSNLTNHQKFDHVIALIEAALRHRQPQPWMYETLALTMQAANRPKEEIERVVMSALDFLDNTADMLRLGVFLTQLNLDDRAIQVFRQVAEMEPLCPVPYIQGLRAAQRINDLDGIEWATTGILSQGWSVGQTNVWQTALRVSEATLKQLRDEKRTKEAAKFAAALALAKQRDCVIQVGWTGDADVDLMVEEPTGSVCSLRNYRTTGGGVFCGDVSGIYSLKGAQHCQMYLCPKGFSGTYKLLVRRVWGKVVAGEVVVEAIGHYGTPKAKTFCKNIPLEKGMAMVTFDLTGGRRTEKLQEQQVVNAAVDQLAVGQQVLAQQMAALEDPNAVGALAAARQANVLANVAAADAAATTTDTGTTTTPIVSPFFIQGAVGYQPIIITLPEGANLMASGVVSADRRYVRVSCVPLFSQISKVTTFNYSTGSSSSQSYPNGYSGTSGGGY